jgi:hypothetical protein
MTVLPARAEQQNPVRYLPSITERERLSDIVCSGTILETYTTGREVKIESLQGSQSIAVAQVDRVFKGVLNTGIIRFEYYGLGHVTGSEYLSPPIASFHAGVRYAIFLKGQPPDLMVTIPLYMTEIQLAPKPSQPAASKVSPHRALACELLLAVQSAPGTVGTMGLHPERMATHYFDWAEELIGKQTIPLVEPFLKSSDPLVRYQAAWWLSFRKLNGAVMNMLESTMRDENLEAWARDGARNRLRDIREGRWVP